MPYRAPLSEITATLELIGADRLAQTERFAEATGETVQAVLAEAGRLCEEVMAPLQRPGDIEPARLENGVVRTSPGFAQGYKAIAQGGWVGISADPEYGGMGLPMTLATALNEMMSSSCLSLGLCPLLSQGQIEALEHHASDELKALYLPKLTSGEWTGTMNLTEPHAGSDVGAIRASATPNGDGSYAVTGQKIYITWGDHDAAENICHLVLARLPDAVPGTKGISLFIVPKFIPDASGAPGVGNTLRCISLEHKLGIHGSPTAVMAFEGATGWLVGDEHGGMAAMFTMMNNARLNVGAQGLGVAEAATQHAVAFAKERKQGRSMIQNGTGTIVDHADVRRMLMTMKSLTVASRAICLDCAFSLDMARAAEDGPYWTARGAFLTPIAKAFSTDIGCEVASLGVQVHGGMGFVEETGAAQYLRDVRITPIYEGTNGIQSMDLVGRKLMDGGEAGKDLLADIAETAIAAEGAFDDLSARLKIAESVTATTLNWMLSAEMNDRFAGAVPFLRAFGLTLGGHYLLRAAMAGKDANAAPLAAFFIRQIMPQVEGLCAAAREGAEPLYAIDADGLAS